MYHFNELKKEAILFGVMSFTDLFLTCMMLSRIDTFHEYNPFANWFYQKSGIAGLALYKISLLCLIFAIVLRISKENVDVAKKLVSFSGKITLGVVVYSLFLWWHFTT